MKIRYAGILLVLCAIVVMPGCMMSEEYADYRDEVDDRTFLENYAYTWIDWYVDMSDLVSMEGSVGEGIGINVQPTKIANFGAMFYDVMKLGYRDRGFGFYREVRKEGGASWFYYRDMEFEPIVGTSGLFDRERLMQDFTLRRNTDRHWMDVGFETHILFFGGSLFVSPKQTLDFLGTTLLLPYNLFWRTPLNACGFNFPEFDLCDDDISSKARHKHGVELIKADDRFAPGEVLNDLMELGY